MVLATHTVTLHTEFVDSTAMDGTWTLLIETSGKRLLDSAGGILLSGDLVKPTMNGLVVYTLPAIPQTGVLPGDASYRLIFEPSSPDADRIVSEKFTLQANKTLSDLLTMSGEPLTLSIAQQAMAAAVSALASLEAITDLLAEVQATVISEDPDDPGTYLIGVVTP